jgi:hypothetical protein
MSNTFSFSMDALDLQTSNYNFKNATLMDEVKELCSMLNERTFGGEAAIALMFSSKNSFLSLLLRSLIVREINPCELIWFWAVPQSLIQNIKTEMKYSNLVEAEKVAHDAASYGRLLDSEYDGVLQELRTKYGISDKRMQDWAYSFIKSDPEVALGIALQIHSSSSLRKFSVLTICECVLINDAQKAKELLQLLKEKDQALYTYVYSELDQDQLPI